VSTCLPADLSTDEEAVLTEQLVLVEKSLAKWAAVSKRICDYLRNFIDQMIEYSLKDYRVKASES